MANILLSRPAFSWKTRRCPSSLRQNKRRIVFSVLASTIMHASLLLLHYSKTRTQQEAGAIIRIPNASATRNNKLNLYSSNIAPECSDSLRESQGLIYRQAFDKIQAVVLTLKWRYIRLLGCLLATSFSSSSSSFVLGLSGSTSLAIRTSRFNVTYSRLL